MSSRFDIMYIGTMDQPNIFKCALKDNPEQRGLRAAWPHAGVLYKSSKIGKNLSK